MDDVPPPPAVAPPPHKKYAIVSNESGDLFLVRKDGETHPLTPSEQENVENTVSSLFLTPLGSGVRVKAPKIFD
jgi:hypothetical protein